MDQFEQKAELMRKYAGRIKTSFGFSVEGDIPSKKIDNAIKKFANGLDRDTVIGFYDTTISDSGKSGYIFTDTKVYYLQTLDKPKKMWYDDIESVESTTDKKKDCDNTIIFHMYDGTTVRWTDTFLNKTPLKDFFNEMIKLINDAQANNIPEAPFDESKLEGAVAGGVAAGAYGQVNKSFDEEKFHSRQPKTAKTCFSRRHWRFIAD